MTTEPSSPASVEPARAAVDDVRGDLRYRVLSPWTIAAWAVLIVLVGVGVAVWLLLAYTGGDADANRVQLDAIRTAGTIVVGTGGAAALLLAARRQRSTEIALKQKDRDQADVARAHALQVQVAEQTRQHQERVAAATEADAEARRITDLFTKAADQLGSEKAPVRLAGLYALERLAQDNPRQRQTIVNVLCAYLRMPYTLPGDPLADTVDDMVAAFYRERVQEREVRLAAQRILAHHLHPGPDPRNPVATFWADVDLDLTGATLIDLKLWDCTTRKALFRQAIFTGDTVFGRVNFAGIADFGMATFADHVSFVEVTFAGYAEFFGATFAGYAEFYRATFTAATFSRATFTGEAKFAQATFAGDAKFAQATFTGGATFYGATFASDAWFYQATFASDALFTKATITRNAKFAEATFTDIAGFSGATLPSTRYAGRDTRWPWTDFAEARFARSVPPEIERFVRPSDAEIGDEETGG